MIVRAAVLVAMLIACNSASAWSPTDSPQAPARQPVAGCGLIESRDGSLGPLDYRTTPQRTIEFVEVRHFTSAVEMLQSGEKGGHGVGGAASDISYMLGVFPNHPRALKAAAELVRRNRGVKPPALSYSLDCLFDRAIAFRPDDADVRIIIASELARDRKEAEARQHALAAEPLVNNARLQYNLGLVFLSLRDYERATKYAKLAYEGGFNLPGLRTKLQQAGQWRD
jgi:hypothetical protein